ncbi:hypothetical protein [Pseudomonas oryzihabitans]|uniref:hypothetical protein n=1 Tax=Pseudomonas oryzihabitans TaxID=47885 RepID=UPI00111DB81A|nr:hypothetical protein [Pseudomonas psychrotolerans]
MKKTQLTFAWFMLFIMSGFLIFKTHLHSDLLFLDSLMVDLFAHDGHWRDWKITPAPAYMPDMLVYFLAYWVLPSAALRVVFVCAAQVLLLAGAILHLAKALQPTISSGTKIVILACLTIVTFIASHSGMWLFFNSTNNHFAALLFPILGLSLVIGLVSRDRGVNYLLLFFCTLAGTTSTSIFVLAFTLPIMIMGIVILLLTRFSMVKLRVWGKVLAVVCLGHVCSIFVNRLLVSYDSLSGRAPMNLEGALTAAKYLYTATLNVFARDNPYTFLLAIVTAFSIAWLLLSCFSYLYLDKAREQSNSYALVFRFPSKELQFFLGFFFLCLAIPISILGVVASGGFLDFAGYRYFAFPIFLAMLLCILKLSNYNLFEVVLVRWLVIGFIALMVAYALSSLKSQLSTSGRGDYAVLMQKGIRGPSDDIASCIDDVAGKGYELGSGIADFWSARGVSYKSSFSPYILPVLQSAEPFFHMMTLGPLIEPKRYALKSYNFAIMNRSGTKSQFDLMPETIGRILPKPDQVFTCAGSDSEVWFYADQRLNNFMQAKIDVFLSRVGRFRRYVIAGDQVLGLVGTAEQYERRAVAGKDSEGFLMYGPYIDLPPGEYQVTIDYSASASGSRWDVGRFNNPEQNLTISSGDFLTTENSTTKHFTLKNRIEQFEIRAWYNGHGNLSIRKVDILRVTEK